MSPQLRNFGITCPIDQAIVILQDEFYRDLWVFPSSTERLWLTKNFAVNEWSSQSPPSLIYDESSYVTYFALCIRFRLLPMITVSPVPTTRYSPCQFDTEVAGSEQATTGTVARAIMPWVALHVDGTVHEPNVTMAVIKQTSSPHLVGSSTPKKSNKN